MALTKTMTLGKTIHGRQEKSDRVGHEQLVKMACRPGKLDVG